MRRDRRQAQIATGGVPNAVIYFRVSSDDQASEGTSLAAQLAECRRYAAQQGFIIDREFSDVLSGTRDDRPGYQELLARVRALRASGQPCVVVVAALDRFGRRMLERVRSRDELKQLGVATHAVREGGEVSDLVANVLASVAQEEVARLGMRVSKAWEHLSELGWYKVGGPTGAAWGYRSRPATAEERRAGAPKSVIEPDPLSGPYAREVFERVAGGEKVRSVARWVAGLPADVRGGRRMSLFGVQYMLRTPVYAARNSVDGPVGRWAPLVDDVTWQRVQDSFDAHRLVPHQASGDYLLTGFLRCPSCGNRMHGERLPAGDVRYRCSRGKNIGAGGMPACHQSAHRGRVDGLVLDELGALVGGIVDNPRVRDGLKRAWQARQMPDNKQGAKRLELIEAQVQRVRDRIRRATELRVDGSIEQQAYEDLVAQARADAESAEKELATLRTGSRNEAPKLPPLEQVLAAAGSWTAVLQGADVEPQRAVLAVLVERIVPIRERPGVYRVEITWTLLGEALRALEPS